MKSDRPAWLSDARVFYSKIEEGSKDPVSVFIPPGGEVSAGNPGTLRLRLEPGGRSLQVLDQQGCNEGVIRSEGLVRGIRYVMRRDENPMWLLSIRSVVRNLELVLAGGVETARDAQQVLPEDLDEQPRPCSGDKAAADGPGTQPYDVCVDIHPKPEPIGA